MKQDKQDIWAPLKFFVGSWEGRGGGSSGRSETERDYEFVSKGKFLRLRNKSIYKPQEKNPKGEIHEDVGYFSYDANSKFSPLLNVWS